MDNTELKPVVVTTEAKGVFFGYVPADAVQDGNGEQITLQKARNCVYWSSAVRGFLGLAAAGPDKQSRVGPAVPSLTLYKVTSIIDCTPEAAAKWEAGLWG